MVRLSDVDISPLPLSVFGPLIGSERLGRLEAGAAESRTLLGGRVVWNVSSTASGGGVAEMLRVLVGHIRGAGIDTRWVVIEGDAAFFDITKRIHNRVHGVPGDDGALGRAEASHYADVTAANASALLQRVRPGDVVLLHDPQTAGMAPAVRTAGVKVVWRSHIGLDTTNQWTEQAWGLLQQYLSECDAFVFSRADYVPAWIPSRRVWIIPPSIDPFSPKNQEIPDDDLPRFLNRIGLTSGPKDKPATFARSDGTPGEVLRSATIVSDGGPMDSTANLVVQVSRWDRLKDMSGVLAGFAAGVAPRMESQLALVGPAIEGVADDPEQSKVLSECVSAWESLPAAVRSHIRIVVLPTSDVEENAAMVNALQRAATLIVQKSLVEGFGLTVAEGMWKGKPVVASRVGGIIDQVAPGTGVLLNDPADLDTFADTLASLLAQPDEVARLGHNARRHVLDAFVGDRHLLQYAALMRQLLP